MRDNSVIIQIFYNEVFNLALLLLLVVEMTSIRYSILAEEEVLKVVGPEIIRMEEY